MPAAKQRRRTRPAPAAMKHKVAPISIDQALQEMSDAHLLCRDLGHTWKRHDARWLPSERCYERTLRCSTCRTLRHQLIGADGERLSAHYDYAEHYLIKGLGSYDVDARNAVRLASTLASIQGKAS